MSHAGKGSIPIKPRVQGKIRNLPAAQRLTVDAWLRQNLTYSEIKKRLNEEIGLSISVRALSEYYQTGEWKEDEGRTRSAAGATSVAVTPRRRAADRSRAWQEKRAALLHEACTSIATQIANGENAMAAIKASARRFRNRSLGDGRLLALSRKSLERHWYSFRQKGEAAFALRCVAPRRYDIDPLLLDLIVQAAIRQSKTIAEVLTESDFTDRKGRPSSGTIYRALRAKEINRFLREERSLIAQRKRCEQKLVSLNARLRELRRAAEDKFRAKGDA